MKLYRLIPTLAIIITPFIAISQQLTLKKVLEIAQRNSLDYKIAYNYKQAGFWNYQSYKSSFLPKITLNGTLPEYFHSISRITLPNGEYQFVPQDVATSNLNIGISQNVGLTGGKVSISSSLERIDNFGSANKTAYSSVPLSFNYYQNSLFYNEFKWQKKIQPLRLEESKRDFIERLEDVAHTTVDKFFDVIEAENQIKLDQQNLKNIDTLVKITNARFEIGTVLLNDLLQSKLSLLNAKKAVANATLNLELVRQSFIRFLGISSGSNLDLMLPEDIKNFEINTETAIAYAKDNRKSVIEFQRRRLEAQQEISKTKSETGPALSIRANAGFSQRGNTFNQSYANLLNNQTALIGISIPLIDWGVNKSNRKRSEANLELENNTIDQQLLSIEQEILLQTMKWNMQQEQTLIVKEASKLALQRYDIAKQKYSLGSISFTEFNNAQLDKDRAVMDYINNLKGYWSMYYLIRKLTHFDFEQNKKIELQDIVQ